MDKDGQLIFNDDPFLIACNTAYQLIEEGKFPEAIEKIDRLMGENPDYPGLVETFRTAKFWKNRSNDIEALEKGKSTADFLMMQWEVFRRYSLEKNIIDSAAYHAAMKYIFFEAAEQYKVAYLEEQSTINSFDLLLNLGVCFITLGEYRHAIEALEFARITFRSNAKLLSLLGEAYYHLGEIPKSLYCFKEAFFVDPSEIDLSLLKAKPVLQLAALAREKKPGKDEREWIPVFGHIEDLFYVKRQVNTQQVESIKREIFTLEKSLYQIGREKAEETNIIPRLINKYLWMLDYFELQHYDFNNIADIRSQLIKIDREIFEEFFKNKPK